MIEKIVQDNTFKKAISKLALYFKINPKIGGELCEKFLIETFNKIGIKSFKIEGRKKADINIDGIDYSIKSSSLSGSQIDTLAKGNLTIEKILKIEGINLVGNKKYKYEIQNKLEVLKLICDSLDEMPIIFINFDGKTNTFKLSEISHEELKLYLMNNIDKIYYRRPKNRNRIELISKTTVFRIQDGTGMTAANAFQRGIWANNISFIKTHINIKNIPIKEEKLFYDN